MTWRVEIGTEKQPLIAEVLTAQAIWKKLSKPAREAVLAAYPDKGVRGHSRTRDSLTLHGFAAWDNAAQDWLLTEAGQAIAKWNRS